jgi:cell envelope opacity-associated protein A
MWGPRAATLRPTYWLLTSLLVALSLVVFHGVNQQPVTGTLQLPLKLSGIDAYDEEDSTAQPGIGGDDAATSGEATDPYYGSPGENWRTIEIKNGDTLADIFSREGIPPQQLHQILNLGGAARNLTTIYPGQTLRLLTGSDSGLIRLEYQINKLNLLEGRTV